MLEHRPVVQRANVCWHSASKEAVKNMSMYHVLWKKKTWLGLLFNLLTSTSSPKSLYLSWSVTSNYTSIFTPHVSDMMGVIVLTSSVCASVSLSWANGQTYGLEFWHGGQVEGYLGQVSRSRSWVKGQGHEVKKCSIGHSTDFWEPRNLSMDPPKEKLRNMTGRNTTWGVFKVYAFFLKGWWSLLFRAFP